MFNPFRLVNRFFRSPIVWGAAASAGYYLLLLHGPLGYDLLQRYTSQHPVEYIETVCFMIGMACLVLKGLDTSSQSQALDRDLWCATKRGQPVIDGDPADADPDTLLAAVEALPSARHDHYLVRRIREALEWIVQRQSADGLEEKLERLAELDADRAHADGGLLRLIIWAIPILGFLGTVVGITMALSSLDPNALNESMVKVTQGLGVKFNTTALALTLSIVLMVVNYFVDAFEGRLLGQVGKRVFAELLGRFELHRLGSAGSAPTAAVGLADSTTRTLDEVIRRQAELWQASLDAAQQRWTTLADEAGGHLQKSLAAALAQSLQAHAEHLVAAGQAVSEQNRRQWEPVHQSLTANAESLQGLQASLVQQAEALGRAVEATGQVTRLEDALNRNLAALGGAQNFEQTVVSLAAAIQLLVGRLGELPPDARSVRLESHRRNSQAA